MAAEEAAKRGKLQNELLDEHKAHAETAQRLVKETSQKIDLAKRLVNAEATSLSRFDAAKELEKQRIVGEELKEDLTMKTKEIKFAKTALKDIAQTPVETKPESVSIKVTDQK